jgi:hypothetical protein
VSHDQRIAVALERIADALEVVVCSLVEENTRELAMCGKPAVAYASGERYLCVEHWQTVETNVPYHAMGNRVHACTWRAP